MMLHVRSALTNFESEDYLRRFMAVELISSVSPLTRQDLVAALQFQQGWGADESIEDMPWQPLAPLQKQLGKVSVTGHAGVQQGVIQSAQSGVPQHFSTQENDAFILAARDVPELVERSCQLDGLLLARTATHHLVPVLVENAPFLLVGEVPNTDEDRTGMLFAGQAGELLSRILASIGLQRDALSMAPAIPWRPPGGQRVAPRDLRCCLPILQRTVALARSKYVVTMGSTAASLLLGESIRLSQIRGRWVEITVPGCPNPLSLLPTLHPMQLVSGPSARRNLWHDMLLLAEKLDV